MADSITPRCAVHGVRHKHPMGDLDMWDDSDAACFLRAAAGPAALEAAIACDCPLYPAPHVRDHTQIQLNRRPTVGDQQDTDLDADIAASRAAFERWVRADERRKAWEWFRDLLDAHMLEGQPVYDEFMADRADVLEADRG